MRSGELAVKIVEGKDDLEDTTAALSGDEQFQVKQQKWIGSCLKEGLGLVTKQKGKAKLIFP